MSIDKALYEAPQGLAGIDSQQPAMEIEIVNPDAVHMNLDGLEINLGKEEKDKEDFSDNLAEFMSEGELTELAGDLVGDFDGDVDSRRDWIQTYVDGLDLLGLKIDERSEPWDGACGVYHPILAEAVTKFQSETIMDTFPASGPVKGQEGTQQCCAPLWTKTTLQAPASCQRAVRSPVHCTTQTRRRHGVEVRTPGKREQ